MITNITLENFKCFHQVSINPKRLTVLIGPNGTGKSSILQALLLLKQSVGTDHIIFEGDSVNLSGPDDVMPNFTSQELVSRFEIHVSSVSDAGREIDNSKLAFSAEFTGNLRLFHPGEIDTGIQTGVPRGSSPVGRFLSQLTFVPAIRGFSRPKYMLGTDRNRQVPLHLSYGGQEEQVATNLAYTRSSEASLSQAMEKVTETEIRVEVVPSNSVAIKSVNGTRTANMVAEGIWNKRFDTTFSSALGSGKRRHRPNRATRNPPAPQGAGGVGGGAGRYRQGRGQADHHGPPTASTSLVVS